MFRLNMPTNILTEVKNSKLSYYHSGNTNFTAVINAASKSDIIMFGLKLVRNSTTARKKVSYIG